MKRVAAICLFLFLFIPVRVVAAVITGGENVYRVNEGDSLALISSKLGSDVKNIKKENNLGPGDGIKEGQELRVNNRKIAPKTTDNGIIVDIPGRMLFSFKAGKLEQSFPVGLGMPQGWHTPTGNFTITGKERDPAWFVPESIKEELQAQGKPVIIYLPPGPNNPLGRFALYTSRKGIAIHETIYPESVYQFRSHGCIRVKSENIERFYDVIEIGTVVESVYEPVKVAVADDGKIFLQVDSDIYWKVKKLKDEVFNRINDLHAGAYVNWEKVRRLIRDKTGNAEDVTLFPAPPPKPRS